MHSSNDYPNIDSYHRAAVDTHLSEFNAIRAEINGLLTHLMRLVEFYFVIFVGVLGLSFSEFGGPLLLFLVIIVTPIMANQWLDKQDTIRRLGTYIGTHLRTRLSSSTKDQGALYWEVYNAIYYKGRPGDDRRAKWDPVLRFFMPGLGLSVLALFLTNSSEDCVDPTTANIFSIAPAGIADALGFSASTCGHLETAWVLFVIGILVNLPWVIRSLTWKDPYTRFDVGVNRD